MECFLLCIVSVNCTFVGFILERILLNFQFWSIYFFKYVLQSDRSLWEGMQEKAEEKKKGGWFLVVVNGLCLCSYLTGKM